MAFSSSCDRQPSLRSPLALKIEAIAKRRLEEARRPAPIVIEAIPDQAITILTTAAAAHYSKHVGQTTCARQVALFLLGEHIGIETAAKAFSTLNDSVRLARSRIAPLVAKRAMAIEPTRNCFEELYTMLVENEEPIRPTRKELIQLCAGAFGISVDDILSQRRDQKIVRPRQLAMWMCKRFTLSSFPEIGRSFDGRDHTTALHACTRIEEYARQHSIDGGDDPAEWAKAFVGIWADLGPLRRKHRRVETAPRAKVLRAW